MNNKTLDRLSRYKFGLLALGLVFAMAAAFGDDKVTSRVEDLGVDAVSSKTGVLDTLKSLGLGGLKSREALLSPDEAFRFRAEMQGPHSIRVSWDIADGYYLYRDKFSFSIASNERIALAPFTLPVGEDKEDPEFGMVQIFRGPLNFVLPLLEIKAGSGPFNLEVHFQGCADRGVCYPPIVKKIQLDTNNAVSPSEEEVESRQASPIKYSECLIGPATGFVESGPTQSEQCGIASSLAKESVFLTVLTFLGMGLLLAFTPCIFPMIPILSGLIVGHGHALSSRKGFLVSLSYVLASASTYTVFGVLAGLFGANLQVVFQEPWVIFVFSGVFVLLSLSMFGLFELQLPVVVQTSIARWSNSQHGGTMLSAAVMGGLSTLIVGPCVAAPLAGALIYIGQTGDALLGGVALFALGLGMGLPLLILGASAGRWLPKVGIWMNDVKAGFGVLLLGVAIWLLSRVVDTQVIMISTALLLIVSSIYLGAFDTITSSCSGWRRFSKGLGVFLFLCGFLELFGFAMNGHELLYPLKVIVNEPVFHGASFPGTQVPLEFKKVSSLQAIEKQVTESAERGKLTMLEVYADWCVSCKEMEQFTFKNPDVIRALEGVTLLKVDVTANNQMDQSVMKHYGLIGPPALLFFGLDKSERFASRIVGYIEAKDFIEHLRKTLQ